MKRCSNAISLFAISGVVVAAAGCADSAESVASAEQLSGTANTVDVPFLSVLDLRYSPPANGEEGVYSYVVRVVTDALPATKGAIVYGVSSNYTANSINPDAPSATLLPTDTCPKPAAGEAAIPSAKCFALKLLSRQAGHVLLGDLELKVGTSSFSSRGQPWRTFLVSSSKAVANVKGSEPPLVAPQTQVPAQPQLPRNDHIFH